MSVYGIAPDEEQIEQATERTAPLAALHAELCTALDDLNRWRAQADDNDDTRFCRWDGQSEDGRKHETELGKEPFPWEGASDTRVRLADSIVNEQVMMLVQAFRNARVQVMPTDSTDVARARLSTDVLRWMTGTHLAADLHREVELGANWRQDKGAAVMGVFWQTETRREQRTMTLEELAAQGLDADALFDPLREEGLIEAAQRMVPGLSRTEARRALEDLRTKGEATVPVTVVQSSRPRWQALMPGIDVVFPARAWDLQRARFIARRERLTETELRERELTDGYDPEWIEAALNHKSTEPSPEDTEVWEHWERSPGGMSDEYVDIWHTYYKATAPDGSTQVFCTVLHREVKDMEAKHEPHPYAHGLYPFVELVRERSRRTILESRGVPELVQTAQAEIKTQRDYRSDRASISILPPFKYPANRGKMQMILGPGKGIPIRRAGEEFGWMNPPPNDLGTQQVEESVRQDVDEYFGIATNWSKNMPVSRQQLHQQFMVSGWLAEMKQCLSQTWQLMQQYMDPVEVLRVTGGGLSPLKATREEIVGRYDLQVEFDVRDLDMEYVGKKAEMISRVVAPLDVAGVLDRAKLVEFLMGWIDPMLARELVKPGDVSALAEAEDEQTQIAKMATGMEPVNKPQGQNYALRLKTIEQSVQTSPKLQQQLQGDELFRQLMENRVKFLRFQIDQQQNAQIGRVGVSPVLGGAA